MNTRPYETSLDFLPEMRAGLLRTLWGKIGTITGALAEGKAAADHYESLLARGLHPAEAADTVFRAHFSKH
jgi:hypothetical protein